MKPYLFKEALLLVLQHLGILTYEQHQSSPPVKPENKIQLKLHTWTVS